MAKVKLDLSRSVLKQIDQGANVVTKSREVMTGTQPVIDTLELLNTSLADNQATVIGMKSALAQAYADLFDAAEAQREAYGNLAGLVQTNSGGGESYILSCGFNVRAGLTPVKPIVEAPTGLRTSINGTPGRVVLSWIGLTGTRLYEVQYTTDLSGATGWTGAAKMVGAPRLNVDALNSGTKYAFRVRALGNGVPGPWSATIAQMAP